MPAGTCNVRTSEFAAEDRGSRVPGVLGIGSGVAWTLMLVLVVC